MHTLDKSQALKCKIEELDRVAAVCHQLCFDEDKRTGAAGMLDKLGDLLGADSAVFRSFTRRQNQPHLDSLVSHSVPSTVTEAYLERFRELDPAMALLGDKSLPPSSMPYGLDGENDAVIRQRENFIRYRDEFLNPNQLFHHIGFILVDRADHYLFFNFHRHKKALAFGSLEQARVRLMIEILQGRKLPLYDDGPAKPVPDRVVAILSDRELDVVRTLICGHSNKQIAVELGISVRTVENHLRRIYRKLGITSRMQLAALMQELVR